MTTEKEQPATKRGPGRPPLPPELKAKSVPKKRHMVAGAVSYNLKRRLALQAAHEQRTIGSILEEALRDYLGKCGYPQD